MAKSELVNLTIRVTPEKRREIAHYTVDRGQTLQDYVLGLIEEDMAKNKERKGDD